MKGTGSAGGGDGTGRDAVCWFLFRMDLSKRGPAQPEPDG